MRTALSLRRPSTYFIWTRQWKGGDCSRGRLRPVTDQKGALVGQQLLGAAELAGAHRQGILQQRVGPGSDFAIAANGRTSLGRVYKRRDWSVRRRRKRHAQRMARPPKTVRHASSLDTAGPLAPEHIRILSQPHVALSERLIPVQAMRGEKCTR